MALPKIRRKLAGWLLIAFLIPVPQATAAPGDSGPRLDAPFGISRIWGQVWSWVTDLVQSGSAACSQEPEPPSGTTSTPPPPPTGVDQGPGIDPNGGG